MSQNWNDEYTSITTRRIIQIILSSRPEIYATPELSPVAGNGGDKINKKIQQILRHLPDGDIILKEEIASTPRKRASGSTPKKSCKKVKSENSEKESPKKRKVQQRDSEKEDSEEAFWQVKDEAE